MSEDMSSRRIGGLASNSSPMGGASTTGDSLTSGTTEFERRNLLTGTVLRLQTAVRSGFRAYFRLCSIPALRAGFVVQGSRVPFPESGNRFKFNLSPSSNPSISAPFKEYFRGS